MIELIYQNNIDGNMHEISTIVSSIDYATFKAGAPAKLELQMIRGYETNIAFTPGSIIAFKYQGKGIFYGYLFDLTTDKDTLKLTFYDQIRYLLSSATYVLKNMTVGQITQSIADDFNLRVGTLDEEPHIIKPLIQDNKKVLDIILTTLDELFMQTNQQYVFFDSFGSLMLRKPQDMIINYIIGEGSLARSFTHKTGIEESYNFIKLVKDNKDTGEREVYVVQDSSTMKKWGKLQFFEVVDEKLNAAQINEQASMLLELHNREKETLDLSGLGNIDFIAGRACYVALQDVGIKGMYVLEEAKHSFKGTQHEMSLKMKVV